MHHSIQGFRNKGRRGFTLIEVLAAALIALYAISAAVASYMMLWSWWHETSPEIEAQRMARIAISTIVYGRPDPTAGTYSIGGVIYQRRNGVSQATRAPVLPSAQSIEFGLEPDAGNARSYYLGMDAASGFNVVCYRDSNNTVTPIASTIGITDLRFSNVINGAATNNVVTVTATVDRDIIGTGSTPHHIHIEYSQPVFLRNVR